MPNNYFSVLYKHIIQVENKNVGLKVGERGTNIPLSPTIKKSGNNKNVLFFNLNDKIIEQEMNKIYM